MAPNKSKQSYQSLESDKKYGPLAALRYSQHFSYPLTLEEIFYWQIHSTITKKQIARILKENNVRELDNYFYLSNVSDIHTRTLRLKYSAHKWAIAKKFAKRLVKIPTIKAIFVTGSLSMNNSPELDDIDFFIVTQNHTLWISRLLVRLLLGKNRRPAHLPEHASKRVSDKICDNMYLDESMLDLSSIQSLYIAHEILQAKTIYDNSDISRQIIQKNPWIHQYLPVAFLVQDRLRSKYSKQKKDSSSTNLLISLLNIIFFAFQYLYMLPKKTNETITLQKAMFHPSTKHYQSLDKTASFLVNNKH